MVEYALTAVSATCALYFEIGVGGAFKDGQIQVMGCLFFTSHIFISIISAGRMFKWQEAGQRLSNRYDRIRDNLLASRIQLASAAANVTDSEKAKMDSLIGQLSRDSAPMRPMDVFNLNSASFVSLGGIIFTYMLVLLQLKIGDSAE